MKSADLVIFGSGSLAEGVVNALSQVQKMRLHVAVVGRNAEKVLQLVTLANARAVCFQSSCRFIPVSLPRFERRALSAVFSKLKPKVVFCAASIQSPWEYETRPNAWTALISRAGYGVTLPLQSSLVAEVAFALSDSQIPFVNACYPDGVNVLLHKVGTRVTCGIGNAAIIEAFCRARLGGSSKDVRVIAHHGHFASWIQRRAKAAGSPRLWIQGKEEVCGPLNSDLRQAGAGMNNVTAATALPLLLSLISGEQLRMSIPAVDGLRGGYPFLLKKGNFKLRLPSGISLDEAIAHNRTGEGLDGLDLESGIRFVGKARRALAAVGYEYSQGFAPEDWGLARDRMLVLRDRLRKLAV